MCRTYHGVNLVLDGLLGTLNGIAGANKTNLALNFAWSR